jgi:CBS domain-containing protein
MKETAPLTVGQVMTPEPVVVLDSMRAEEAVRLLEEHAISGLPVVDADGVLVGVISESDIVRARATEELWQRWANLYVSDLMHAPALTADPSMTIEEAAQLMERHHVHRLVLVGEDQLRPIGIVSTSDLVRALAHRPTDA